MSLPSIRRRLASSLIMIALSWGVVLALAAYAVVRHEVDEMLDESLRESAEVIYGLISLDADRLAAGARMGTLAAPPHREHLVWQWLDARGQVRLRSHRAPVAPLVTSPRPGFAETASGWRVYGLPLATTGQGTRRDDLPAGWVLVAHEGSERREARFESTMVAAGGSLMAGLVAAMLLSWRARRELAPLESLSEAVRQIDPGRPAPGMATTERSELEPIRAAINDLAARLARRLAGERAFSAHAAHALRTPLAGLDAQLAVCQLQADERLAPRLQRSRDAVARLRSVVQALLTFFRSGGEPHWQVVSLQAVGERLGVESLVLHWRGLTSVIADPDLLAAALMNLLDNAQRYGASEVVVEAGSAPGTANVSEGRATDIAGLPGTSFWISVLDDGPGIPKLARERLQAALDRQGDVRDATDPGSEGAQEGAAGSKPGLGLVLCDLVARAHGGRLRLMPSAAGTCARLEWNAPQIGP